MNSRATQNGDNKYFFLYNVVLSFPQGAKNFSTALRSCLRACDKSQQQKIPLQSWFIQKRNKKRRKRIHWVAKLNSSPSHMKWSIFGMSARQLEWDVSRGTRRNHIFLWKTQNEKILFIYKHLLLISSRNSFMNWNESKYRWRKSHGNGNEKVK